MIEYAVMHLEHYKSACNNIRAKTESTLPITSNELASKIEEVFNAGKAEGSANATILYGTYVIKENITFEEVGGIYVDEDVSDKNIYAYFYDNDTQSYQYKKIVGMMFESPKMPICWYTDDRMQTALDNGKWVCSSNGVRGNLPNSKGRIIVFTEPTFITTDFYNAFTSAIDEGFDIFADGKQDGISEGIAQGADAEKKRWWGIYQDYGNRTDCANMFSGRGWNDQTFTPKYDIVSTNNYMMFRYCGIVDIEKALKDNSVKVIINNGNLTITFNSMLTQILGEVYFNTPITVMAQTFAYNSYLQEIRSELPVTEITTYNGVFDGCNELKEVRFSGTIGQNGLNFQWSRKLSKASFVSVISHFLDSASGLSATFSKTACDKAFETSVGANDGSTSTEWLNLIATKPNWSIKLV